MSVNAEESNFVPHNSIVHRDVIPTLGTEIVGNVNPSSHISHPSPVKSILPPRVEVSTLVLPTIFVILLIIVIYPSVQLFITLAFAKATVLIDTVKIPLTAVISMPSMDIAVQLA